MKQTANDKFSRRRFMRVATSAATVTCLSPHLQPARQSELETVSAIGIDALGQA
jgi:hypothetical protein